MSSSLPQIQYPQWPRWPLWCRNNNVFSFLFHRRRRKGWKGKYPHLGTVLCFVEVEACWQSKSFTCFLISIQTNGFYPLHHLKSTRERESSLLLLVFRIFAVRAILSLGNLFGTILLLPTPSTKPRTLYGESADLTVTMTDFAVLPFPLIESIWSTSSHGSHGFLWRDSTVVS